MGCVIVLDFLASYAGHQQSGLPLHLILRDLEFGLERIDLTLDVG
jgi:hypothetical protein